MSLLVSCKKATEPQVTSFQLEVSDYFTGDSMPDFPFRFSGVYTSSIISINSQMIMVDLIPFYA
ncbi:MAG: hypothetical protein IPG07_15965 [Crocinitomicaceae bacterium]|nr:hypothetical protein [Crocinitomicaceae bacterium]